MLEQYRLKMKNVSKSFTGVHALIDVSLEVHPGEIHALVGENGAGKSTLMKILSGAYKKDSGEIFIDDKLVNISDPTIAMKLGIGIIYQEFELVPDLTIAENIFIDRLQKGRGIIHWNKLFQDAKVVVDRLGLDIDPKDMVSTLSVAYQQIVEIAKALSRDVRILVLDEPTSALAPKEVQILFKILLKLKGDGVSIIYISHRLDEIFKISDFITTMRDGKVTGNGKTTEFDLKKVVKLMIGRNLSSMFPKRNCSIGDTIFEVKNFNSKKYRDINFTVRKGEVVGFSGLIGSGRTELARGIFGADKKISGEMILNGNKISILSPVQAVKHGIGFITENRRSQGLITEMSVRNNTTITNLKKVLAAFGVIRFLKEKALVSDLVNKLGIKTGSIETLVQNLSGGNQQKVVVAKWLNIDLKIVIFDEPTRGVDVGAKYEIYKIINNLVENGVAVILISSEIAEVIGMCDRVMVMADGKIQGELNKEGTEEITEAKIMMLSVGGEKNGQYVQ